LAVGCGGNNPVIHPPSVFTGAAGTSAGAVGGTLGGGGSGVGGTGGAASASGCPAVPATRPAGTPSWDSIADLRNPPAWYTSPIAAYVSENVLYYQNRDGGWPKNIDMSLRYGVDTGASMKDDKSMIDNDATTTQIRYLASALGAWPDCGKYADSFNKGMQFLFNAQYPANGGWPQVFPIEPDDYSRHITYNDNAMVHVLQIMRDIAYGAQLFKFTSAETVAKAKTAFIKGVDCVLKTQIVVDGKKTGWCAQHDAVTLLAANARSYELASESGKEGAQLLAFLMTLDIDNPDLPRQAIIDAVEGAVVFYDQIKITGLKYVQGSSDAGPEDSWVEADPTAAPIWARFYELVPPFRPFFCDRDGIKKYSLAEIGVERRGGYAWYGRDPSTPLLVTYPAWVTKWAIGRNVLSPTPSGDGGAPDTADTPDASVD
jgi:PelA/Pel-15E family pectate lyase